jgi:GNAT superfamily N-acetyltransferase
VHIERFDARTDDARLRLCHQMTVDAQPEDDPNVPPMLYEQFRGWWAFGFSDSTVETWLATDESGEPAGAYALEFPERENRGNAFTSLIVAPSRRRRGTGRALLAHMAGQAARRDRSLLLGYSRIGSAGTAFAAATGGRKGMVEVRRRQDLSEELRDSLPALRAGAERHAADYALREWCGPTPPEYLEGVCALYTALADAPHDEAFEPAVWDADRVQRGERRLLDQGTRWHSVVAVAESTGEVAAITQVNLDDGRPDWGWQEITAVVRSHRGHRLGLLVKVAMLDLLAQAEPALAHIVTTNAEQNEHMIGVNAQLGYQVTDHFQSWEHDVAAARALSG